MKVPGLAENVRVSSVVQLVRLIEVWIVSRRPGVLVMAMLIEFGAERVISPNSGATAPWAGMVMVVESRVTAPMRTRARPSSFAPVAKEIDWSAMMLPLKAEVVPMAAEVPTCQNTLAALVPPARITWLPAAAVRTEATWKM